MLAGIHSYITFVYIWSVLASYIAQLERYIGIECRGALVMENYTSGFLLKTLRIAIKRKII